MRCTRTGSWGLTGPWEIKVKRCEWRNGSQTLIILIILNESQDLWVKKGKSRSVSKEMEMKIREWWNGSQDMWVGKWKSKYVTEEMEVNVWPKKWKWMWIELNWIEKVAGISSLKLRRNTNEKHVRKSRNESCMNDRDNACRNSWKYTKKCTKNVLAELGMWTDKSETILNKNTATAAK